jgi:hypothetical protein
MQHACVQVQVHDGTHWHWQNHKCHHASNVSYLLHRDAVTNGLNTSAFLTCTCGAYAGSHMAHRPISNGGV